MEESSTKSVDETKPHFFIVRVTVGREAQAMERLDSRLPQASGIYSVIKPYSFKGYLIVEADSVDSVEKIIYGIRYLRGVLRREISFEEVIKLIKKKKEETVVNIGDIVRVVAGPFKGESATVKNVNKEKDEVGVMFLDSAVPITVGIKISDIEVVKAGEQNENKG